MKHLLSIGLALTLSLVSFASSAQEDGTSFRILLNEEEVESEINLTDCSLNLIVVEFSETNQDNNKYGFDVYRDGVLIQSVRGLTFTPFMTLRIPIPTAYGDYEVYFMRREPWSVSYAQQGSAYVDVNTDVFINPNINFCGPSQHGMTGFGLSQGWAKTDHPVMLADVDGNGTADILGFASHGVDLALNQGGSWAYAVGIPGKYGSNQGFFGSNSIRTTAKLNYDNRADVVVFGPNGVETEFANPSGGYIFKGNYSWFGSNTGWNVSQHERFLADVNGDGLDDIIGFGNVSTQVSASDGNGGYFPLTSYNGLAYNYGWRKDKHVRTMANVNNDGMADIVAFGDNMTYVLVYDKASSSYVLRNEIDDFHYAAGYRVDEHVRYLRDVNGDGRDDIIAFGNDGVRVALANSTGYDDAQYWIFDFGKFHGWRNKLHPRLMGDINGDGMADIVGFFEDGIWASLSTGSSFTCPETYSGEFSIREGFTVENHPRWLADIDGDGRMEIVANSNTSIQYFNCHPGAPTFRIGKPADEAASVAKAGETSIYPTLLENHWDLTVVSAPANSQINVVDLTGKIVINKSLSGSETETISLGSDLRAGMYFVRIIGTQSNLILTEKIVIR